ncbi:Nucleobase-ascorbate transporter 12 [Linum perenne]
MSGTDPKTRPKPGPFLPTPESSPLPPASWAKKTGFRPKFSGETNASDSGQISPLPPRPRSGYGGEWDGGDGGAGEEEEGFGRR